MPADANPYPSHASLLAASAPPDRCAPPFITDSWGRLFAEIPVEDGMRISFHHHLRLGDEAAAMVLAELDRRRIRDLVLSVSSIMGPACEAAAGAVRSGCVRRIGTTGVKEPLAGMIVRGEIGEPVIFRSHGGRARAVREGELPIGAAFIAASAVDRAGNLNGTEGPSRFGSMGYEVPDAGYARKVVAVTDNLCDEPLEYVAIPGKRVDAVMQVESIGNRELITGGSLRQSADPLSRHIAAHAGSLLLACGAIRQGWAYQAGSGTVSLQVTHFAAAAMREQGIRGSFASGGITADLVELLQEGLFETLLDVQSFDQTAVWSLRAQERHREMGAGTYADPGIPGHAASRLDVMILSAAEADDDFNINSLTGTDGRILGALGGAPDTAAGAGITIAVLPSVRGRIPTLHRRVRTICTPGSDVDIIVTEQGYAVNPRREDLLRQLAEAPPGLVRGSPATMAGMREAVHRLTGVPDYPKKGGRVVGRVCSRYGPVLDEVWPVSIGSGLCR